MNAARNIRPLSSETESAALSVVHLLEVLMQHSKDLDADWYESLGLQGNAGRVALRLLVLGPATATELSRHINITSAGMTSLIDRLEALQLVMRRKHPTDRRRMLVYPSKRLQASFLQRNTHRAELLYAGCGSLAALGEARGVVELLADALTA